MNHFGLRLNNFDGGNLRNAIAREAFAIVVAMPSPTTRTKRWVPWLIWATGSLAYILTVMQRTTLAAAGLDAADRFGIGPGALSVFVFIQVAVFAAMQIPAGLLVDRYGARALLVVNGVLLFGGQLLLAHTTSFAVAVIGRVLVGAGDAIVFAATREGVRSVELWSWREAYE